MRRTASFLLAGLLAAAAAFAQEIVPPEIESLPAEVGQALYVYPEYPGTFAASLDAWERKDKGWEIIHSVPAVIGRNGFAPAGEKREGDGRTPSGTFALLRAFGYEAEVETGLDYVQATEKDFWIDAPDSPMYNQWVSGLPPQESHEVLRRADDMYKYAAVIEYNTAPVVPGAGSAIFLHVWRDVDKPTAGCVAVAEPEMIELLRWLDAARQPVIVLGGAP